MGANLQSVFYRGPQNAILVRVMLNEEDVRLPLEAEKDAFYSWSDLYDYYIHHCNAVEEMLDETKK